MLDSPVDAAAPGQRSARALACVVFLLGIGLLCAVFALAWGLFHAPVPGLNLSASPAAVPPPAASIGAALTAFLRQLLLLALMTVAGSIVAGKGVHLYFSALPTRTETPSAREKDPARV